jgi:hypothetical protein
MEHHFHDIENATRGNFGLAAENCPTQDEHETGEAAGAVSNAR